MKQKWPRKELQCFQRYAFFEAFLCQHLHLRNRQLPLKAMSRAAFAAFSWSRGKNHLGLVWYKLNLAFHRYFLIPPLGCVSP
ncbi:hypothetical protein MA16_Dca008848 [Dendrobium catenatum]|uniref:Uncharacterized protein n=1 Tax=Dendrobium catenatum TaxID=906689 RepID=A0A2I0VUI9_9ASPA|nr:hypothetical protein MA16_Dca008848 [Dendrobium catenatum]